SRRRWDHRTHRKAAPSARRAATAQRRTRPPRMSPRLVLATHNEGKLAELREILGNVLPPEQVASANDLGVPEVKETGITFAENALIKARAVATHTGLIALADDSGLAVDVLGGAPGIFSARWAGHHGDDEANIDLLLAQLADIPADHRGAAFVCAAAMATPGGGEAVEHGYLRGALLTARRGTHGFGYDPILQPEGYSVSTAQMSPEEKNAISHRGKAFRALIPHVREALAN